MHFNDKSLVLKKNMPNSTASISYYSGYNNTINNFDQSNFKPVMRYSNSAACNKASNLENKSFSSSISSSSSSSSSSASACQSDQHLNQIYSITNKITSPSSLKKPSPALHLNQNTNYNSSYSTGASNQYDEETENQIDRIINDLKNCSLPEPYLSNQSSQSYKLTNTNRLSSYDNHDIQEYLNVANNNLNTINESSVNSVKSVQSNNNQFQNNALLPSSMLLNAGVYSKKRASITGPGNTNANQSKNKTSNSTTAINLTDMNQSPKASSNLFTRAFRNGKSTKNPNSNSSSCNKETWKTKLGKYLPNQLSNSGRKGNFLLL